MSPDEIILEVLVDGTVRVTTPTISAGAHKSADELLAFLVRELGGPVRKVKRAHGHAHTHTHNQATA